MALNFSQRSRQPLVILKPVIELRRNPNEAWLELAARSGSRPGKNGYFYFVLCVTRLLKRVAVERRSSHWIDWRRRQRQGSHGPNHFIRARKFNSQGLVEQRPAGQGQLP